MISCKKGVERIAVCSSNKIVKNIKIHVLELVINIEKELFMS